MNIPNMVRAASAGFDSAAKVLNWVGYISLTGIVLITSVDVIGRYCFNSPLLGGVEILELSMAVLGGFAMLYTTTQRLHISVDLFFVRFSKRGQMIVESFGSVLGFAVWGVIAYQVYALGTRMLKSGDITNLLHLPLAPFQFVLALGLALHGLALLIQGVRALVDKEPETKEGGLSI